MRWYSLNGVPLGSKNGSGASIRMRSAAFCDGPVADGEGKRVF
jgi:hypothetical protein